MKVLESSENYLETILVLKKSSGEVKAVDIARHLGYSKPSISAALKLLKQNGYITVAESGYISLTKEGLEIAHKIYLRHTVLTQFLISLGVSPETAQKDACKIEHYLSAESMERITASLEKKKVGNGE
ncbi:MAG: metal-dependent transcriptional regulator [Thermoguttaceae bacterium]